MYGYIKTPLENTKYWAYIKILLQVTYLSLHYLTCSRVISNNRQLLLQM